MPTDPHFSEGNGGMLVSIFAGLSTALATLKAMQMWLARRRKDGDERSVGMAETTRKTVADIMQERREEVASLKAEIASLKAEYVAQAVRHRNEIAEQESRHEQIMQVMEKKYDNLEEQHYKTLIELAGLRKDFESLKARMDGK